MFFVLLFVAGALGGVLGGMGMGGGTILIPMLTVFFDIAQKQAQAINLIAFIPMAIVALIMHFKNKLVHVKYAIWLSVSAVLFSVGGSLLVKIVSGDLQVKLFGGFLMALAVYQLICSLIENKNKENNFDADKKNGKTTDS